MIEEVGVVTACAGDHAWVHTRRQTTCGNCGARQGCGTAVLAKVLGRSFSTVRALNTAHAREGDRVVIGLSEQALLRGSAAVYLAPLLSMVVMALVGEALAPQWFGYRSELLSIAFGLCGLALGFIWLYLFGRKIRQDGAYQPVVLRRLVASSNTSLLSGAGSTKVVEG